MTTCVSDNFTVSADVSYPGVVSLNGCYEAVDELNGETQYYLDGDDDDGQPSVFASSGLDPSEVVWMLAYIGDNYNYTCRDADENDATALLHPTNVAQWNCTEELGVSDFTVLDSMTATCGCGESTTTETSSSGELTPGTSSSEQDTPVGAIAGGVVAGVLVIVAVILAVLFKTGRLQSCRWSSSKTSADDVTPAPPRCPVPAGNARPQASEGPISQYPRPPQYPVAHQYPQAL
ncbi:unnamed protein product [Ectocarpus sp. 6 AP-2014]